MSDREGGSSVPSEQDDNEQQEWSDWSGSNADEDATRSLFCTTVLPSPEAAMDYDTQRYGFDIRHYRLQCALGDHDTIRLVNYIRHEVAAGRDPRSALKDAAAELASGQPAAPSPWSADDFLRPVVPGDPLITFDYEPGEEGGAGAGRATLQEASCAPPSQALRQQQAGAAALYTLREENEALRATLAALALDVLPAEALDMVGKSVQPGHPSMSAGHARADGPSASTGGAGPSGRHPAGSMLPQEGQAGRLGSSGPSTERKHSGNSSAVDTAYFSSYSRFSIHREMLGDKPRTEAYQQALERNPSLVKGARVLDVGCGTGILSMFAARGGAARVVGLDGSSFIANLAAKVAAGNKLSVDNGGPVRIIAGRVEEVDDIGLEQVDVIVSEWMGYALLFEAMLDAVLVARDRWLRPGGAVLPDITTVHIAGANADATGLGFWKDVYGFDMGPIAAAELAGMDDEVLVRTVDAPALVTSSCEVAALDLITMSSDQQDFTADFVLHPTPEAVESNQQLAAFVLWFDAHFSERFCTEAPGVLSTAPTAPSTHWAQAVLPLRQPVALQSAGGPAATVKLSGRISMVRAQHKHRTLDISLEYTVSGPDDQALASHAQLFSMSVGGDASRSPPEPVRPAPAH